MSSISSTSSVGSNSSATTSSSKTIPTVSYDQTSNRQLSNISVNLTAYQNDLNKLSGRYDVYTAANSALQTLLGALPSYQDQTQVAGLTASSSSTAIGVSMRGKGVAGSYNVSVTQLARGQINQSSSKASNTVAGAWGDGTLSIKVGSNAAVNVSVANTMTVQQLSDAINAAKAGVTASVGGTTGAYYVTVAGNGVGTNSAVTYTESGSSTGIGGNVTQSAANTLFTVNGTSYNSQNYTSTNGIPGVTMNFSALVNNATVTVGANATTVASSVTSFVAAYNTAMTAVNTALNGSSQPSDIVLRTLKKQLQKIAGGVSSGASGTFMSLGDLGITRAQDGTLTVNSNTLSAAATTNASSVANLLTGTSNGTGLAADLSKVVYAFGRPGIGELSRDQTSMVRNGVRLARSIDSAQATVDRVTTTVGRQYPPSEGALSG